MQNLLKKYCLDDKDNGLLLFDMPTGSGKTYNVVDFMFNNFEILDKKVFYITPLKKNLAYEKLQEKFVKANKLNAFNNQVLYIKSNVDSIIDNFNDVYKEFPEKIKFANATKHVKVLIEIIKSNLNIEFKNEAMNSLREEWEPEFRSIIETLVLFDDNNKKRNYDQRFKFIMEEHPWIKILYPAVLTDKAKIIFMTVDKFLAMNSTIIRPSYTIIGDDIINDSIIFIDEFDSAKENMLNSIIQNAINSKVALLDLFHAIYAGLTVCDFTKKLMMPSHYNIERKNVSYNFLNPNEIIEQIKKYAEDLKQKYNLQFLHKLESNVQDGAYFMFQDHRFISILPENKSFLLLNTEKNENINKIVPSDYSNDKLQSLRSLLFDLNNFLTFFQIGVGFIANNYKQLKLELNEDKNLISYDACVKTVLAEFGLEGRYLQYFSKTIVKNKRNKDFMKRPLAQDLDFTSYEKGFRYYAIVDSDLFDTQSKINYIAINDSPEKILLNVCSKAKVIGISASSSIRTVTGNFDLNYLEAKLDIQFEHITKEEREILRQGFSKQICHYDRTNINICPIKIDEMNIEETIAKFSTNIAKEIEKIFKLIEKDFDKIRYLKLFVSMQNFLNDSNQYSFLFITNKLLRDSKNFNIKDASKIYGMLSNEKQIDAYLFVLFGDVDLYEQKKKEIEEKLASGKKVMVISSYQTLGAGQNLQYKIPSNFIKNQDYVAINDLDYLDKEKDFDSIFLDRPTNIFVNMNDDLIEETQFIKYICQNKFLEENGEIDEQLAYENIKKGFESIHKLRMSNFKTPDAKSIKLHVAKIIQQAIGRICRTKHKSKEIHIYFDDKLKLDMLGIKKHYKRILINPEFKAFLDYFDSSSDYEDNSEQYNNMAKAAWTKSEKYISKIMDFRNGNIDKWERLREIVLRSPTTNNPAEGISIYVKLPKQNNQYSYSEKPKKISFTDNIGDVINEQNSGLTNMLLIPGLKDFFKENNYAVSFKRANYILTPAMFERIYKGMLGETAGYFIFKNLLNVELDRIRDGDRYEKFDFYKNDVYIDFKNYSGFKDFKRDEVVVNIKDKLKNCGGNIALIINILKPAGLSPYRYIDNIDKNVVIIPYLYDLDKKEFNNKALAFILKLFRNAIDFTDL